MLLTQKTTFKISDILPYPQIFFTQTSPMRKLQEHIYAEHKLSITPTCEAEEIEVILNMVEQGFGISILPCLDIFKIAKYKFFLWMMNTGNLHFTQSEA
mgnify:CR=1 FL=1